MSDHTREETTSRRTWLGSISRRSVLATTPLAALAGFTAACTPERGSDISVPEGDIAVPDRPAMPPAQTPQTLRFFTAEEARAVEAFVARIMPGDADDPGAVEAGVVVYIDAKLADFAGFAEPAYMVGPFANQPAATEGAVAVEESQLYRYGYQSHLTPREIYHLGVPALDRYSQTRFGSLFHLLTQEQQDTVLAVLDAVQQRSEAAADEVGALPGNGAEDEADEGDDPSIVDQVTDDQMDQAEDVFGDLSPGLFFSTLRTDTIEGMFSDPSYGGNVGMVGWLLLGYPGSQRSYSPQDMMNGSVRTPQPMHELTAMSPDRPGGHPALEQHDGSHVGD